MRPLIVFSLISMLLLTFYIREGEAGPIHAVRSGVTTITSPVRFVGSAVAAPFNAIGNVFSNLTASQETLDELKKQNEDLTSKVAELSEAQKTAERLEGLVGLQSTYNLKSTAARIVGASGDAWTSTVTIDKGSADGLSINMPVTSSAGVIGQIIEVSAKTSTVRLIGDENSGVSAMVQDTRAQGMLQGQADGTLRLEYVSVDSDVKVGDIIVTSGIGGVFPKGLPLGTVSSVEKSANDVYYTIVVRAQTTAENNEEVLVITSLTDEQSASDEDVSTANSTPQGTSRDAATKTKDESSDDSSDTSETTDSGSSEEGGMSMDLHEQGAGSRTFVIAAVVCVLLQAGLAPQISIAGGRVNFMIILVCLSAFSGDPARAVVCGFCSGLFYDLSAAVPVGVMSLLLTVGSFALVHSAAGQTSGTPSARGITVGVFALIVNAIYSIILLFMGLETSFVVAIFGHALPSSILTGLVAIPFLMSGIVPQSGYGFSARGGRQTGMRFKPKTRKLK